MNIYRNSRFLCVAMLLLVGPAMAGCGAGYEEDGLEAVSEETPEETLSEEASAPLAEASATPQAEILAVNESVSKNCGIFGDRKDYCYPLGGRRVTRNEFHVDKRGHADVNPPSFDNDQACVHAWCDAFSGYDFTLKVWVEQ